MSSSDFASISLTERQEEVVDWLMGIPAIQNWRDERTVTMEYEREFSRPELEGSEFSFPPIRQFVGEISDELDRFQDMAVDSAEIDTYQGSIGLQRVCNNIISKMYDQVEEIDHDLKDKTFLEVDEL